MAAEGFWAEEAAQLSPIEGPFSLIVTLGLFAVFSSVMAYSYQKYDEEIESREKFYAALEFSNLLRNNILCANRSGVLSPGLITDELLLERGSFEYLNKFWYEPYEWEIVIREPGGGREYEFGSLNKNVRNPLKPRVYARNFFAGSSRSVQVIHTIVALRKRGGEITPAGMEVWVW